MTKRESQRSRSQGTAFPSIFSVFEVLEVVRNRSITMRDLQGGEVYTVTEKRATRTIAPGYLVSATSSPYLTNTTSPAPWVAGHLHSRTT
jgi:hypothetical protein